EKETRENKEARLLLQLYKKGRIGLFMKTYKYFMDKYPKSEYEEMIKHLAAEMFFDKSRKENDLKSYQQARAIYLDLLKKFPESPLRERTELLLGYAELERENGIETIQSFQAFLEKNKNSEYKDQAKKAIAAGFLILNKYDDALASYEDLSKTANSKKQGIEAYYRIGDVYFQKRDYKKAITAYENALKLYPEYESQFPNAHYNMGEANFWLGNYKGALNNYVEFLSRFPSHPHGGYAMTRIGENLDILGADKSEVIGAYLESYFRYRDNPGAKIARIRMLSQQMKGMKEKELKKAMEEIDNIAQTSDLPRINEFVTLMKADGFSKRDEHLKAMNLLITYYQKNPTSTDVQFFKQKIMGSIAEVMNKNIRAHDYMDVLKFNGKYQKTWLRSSQRLDIPYFIGQAYEQAGVFKEAYLKYDETYEKLLKIQGTFEEKEKRVTEKLPTLSELRLRMAKTHTARREYIEAQQLIKDIDKKELRTPNENIELVELKAEVFEQRGLLEESKKSLIELEDGWKGKPELLAPVLVRLARNQMKTKEYIDAIQTLGRFDDLKTASANISNDLKVEALRLRGETLEKQGKKLAAVETYMNLLSQFESQKPMTAVRYRAGRILFDSGDINGAEKIWEKIDEAKEPMFRKLADERLKDAKWQNDYKKYINRIPAMSEKK
ncbi:MAG: tetratricopeptide repeat protein, partial [Bdellovibrionales bacterium]|nr:tetratricopeptide repeat protein [Bdellovibrionales bacterium]